MLEFLFFAAADSCDAVPIDAGRQCPQQGSYRVAPTSSYHTGQNTAHSMVGNVLFPLPTAQAEIQCEYLIQQAPGINTMSSDSTLSFV